MNRHVSHLQYDLPDALAPPQKPLRICLLSYRSHPNSGGQGVYVRNLSNALCRLGHYVDVVSGPPYPQLDNGARLHRLPSLDLYNPEQLFRTPTFKELCDPVNLMEWLGVSTMGFPEPLTFGIRARRFLKTVGAHYDIVHDNQSLSYGIWAIAKHMPTVATIHHPITVDRSLAVHAEGDFWHKAKQWRWYSFIGMQKRVAPTLKRIITVSRCARDHISEAFQIPADRFQVVPNGIDTDRFYPIPGIERQRGRLMVTTSADTPLKGLEHLLRALAMLAPQRPELHLIVVGTPKENSRIVALIETLGIRDRVRFTGALSHQDYVRHYARAWTAVVPSLYEGFGLPAGEAMACGVPVISTTGGALPEVVGDAGVLVPPGDPMALAKAIAFLCDHPEQAHAIGAKGYQRATTHFSWQQAARKTVAVYTRVLHDYGRL
jgi:glycosyltransferase involved in cell wall biosynthesis